MAGEGSERRREVATGTVDGPDDIRVIDLAALETSAPGAVDTVPTWQVTYDGSAPRRARHLPWAVAVALLGATALVLATVALVNYQRAMDWREHAEQLRVREASLRTQIDSARVVVEEAEEALATAEQRIYAAEEVATTTHEQLTAVTSDVAALEARISALANEKAQAEDDRWLAGVGRARATGVAVRADVLGDDLHRCVESMRRWRDGRPSPAADAAAWEAWGAQGRELAVSCDALATDFEQLSGQLR